MVAYYGNDLDNAQIGGFPNYYGGDGNDFLNGDANPNQVYGGSGNDVLAGGTYLTFTGTGVLADPIELTSFQPSGNDYLEGGFGSDVMYGADGDDEVYGGDGDDSGSVATHAGVFYLAGLYGGAGNDFLDGGQGNDSLFGGDDNDILYGSEGNDDLHGQQGNDTEYGGAGNDTVDGGPGEDVLFGGSGNDVMAGGPGNDWMEGDGGDDMLTGADGDDRLKGDDGLDILKGGLGNDVMTGGDSSDQFTFDTALGATNVDTITDFEVDIDLIALSQAVFAEIGPTLERREFYEGRNAHDANDRIILKGKKLYYDHDGQGGDAKVLFARFDEKLNLSHTDFIMVA